MKALLEKLEACYSAKKWAETMDWKWPRIYAECGRGDWLLWLFERTNPDDVRLRVLAAARCAETVRHLMTDKRSTDTLDAAIRFGLGQIDEDELKPFVDPAWDAVGAAAAEAAAASVDVAAVAVVATVGAAVGAAVVEADADKTFVVRVEKQQKMAEHLQKTADIVRSLIPIEKFEL